MLKKLFVIVSLPAILVLNSCSSSINIEPFADYGIVASAHPIASEAGFEILQAGGNAVDAAVATALVLNVVEPYASGLGGGGFLTIKMKDEKPITIDYREAAPLASNDSVFYSSNKDFKSITRVTPNAVGVPGVLAGMAKALEIHGSMTLAEVAKPAIRIAQYGYPVNQTMSDLIMEKYGLISDNDETSGIYLNDGLPPELGDTLKNSGLAESFKIISEKGSKSFYSGEIASSIVEHLSEMGGIMSIDDFKNYKALIKEPVIGNYKGYEIISVPPPSGGGTHLIELLNILENFDLHSLGHNSAEYIHIFAEAIRIIQSDKSFFMADPDYFDVPVNKLIDKEYARKAASVINTDRVMEGWNSSEHNFLESGSTTSLSVIDAEGNMITLTQSINLFFGSGITVPGTGILLNNHMDNFDSSPGKMNSIEPGKRPVSSIAPTLILKDGKPVLTIGTPGGSRIIGSLAQIIVNIVDFNMTLQDAIDAPRIHATKDKLHVEGGISADVIAALEAKGNVVETHSELDKYFGGAQGVMIDYENHSLIGAADPRRGGAVDGR